MVSVPRQGQAGVRWLSPPTIAAIGLISALALAAATPEAGAHVARIIPAVGSYKASGRGDPPNYAIRAQVKSKAGRTIISAQVEDTCGGFVTIAYTAVARASSGAPVFSARVGGAGISGRWTSSTRIEGRVKTPCAARQDYVMHLTG
jgi:hypothetical protein